MLTEIWYICISSAAALAYSLVNVSMLTGETRKANKDLRASGDFFILVALYVYAEFALEKSRFKVFFSLTVTQ